MMVVEVVVGGVSVSRSRENKGMIIFIFFLITTTIMLDCLAIVGSVDANVDHDFLVGKLVHYCLQRDCGFMGRFVSV